ncbi:MAG TPA: hypothetical protein PK847_16070, partial [Candidatus Sumerlaeota bacterium]|nr:hypothetical protein [Candidatus Sumerlaeota bacterium]
PKMRREAANAQGNPRSGRTAGQLEIRIGIGIGTVIGIEQRPTARKKPRVESVAGLPQNPE